MQGYFLEYDAHTVVARKGDPSVDLFFLQSGKLLICTMNGTQVKALARISPGEFIGELSFFDGKTRSSHIITLEKSKLIQIPKQEVAQFLPDWYLHFGKNMTKKIRLLDNVIQETNIRRSDSEAHKPLSIDEQRVLLELLAH